MLREPSFLLRCGRISWAPIEAAIRAERIAEAAGRELAPEYQQLLTMTRNLPSVNLARAQLSVLLPSTTSQFLQLLVP